MSNKKLLPAGCRCLILEDEFLIALDLQDMLESAGATVACFSNADKAMATLKVDARFDFAILDVNLGGTNDTGLVAADLTARGIPFIFLTGLPSGARPLGYDAPVLEKPYQQAVLLEAIHKVWRSITARQADSPGARPGE